MIEKVPYAFFNLDGIIRFAWIIYRCHIHMLMHGDITTESLLVHLMYFMVLNRVHCKLLHVQGVPINSSLKIRVCSF